ncbi:histone-lysine N-methyltransferase SETD1B [Dorcoceras hygrometricum]|uniref:Histone-lysine N-methyltransferase SETD1B n=1 Tax=Dorcoceras hygrometricum TaxID=472368 RepID=A0A2Z7CY82_9LAMI|nr:histone-lysine N-methyltransferase SETD1B [Dorcoceras hygrometricum]
MDLDRPHYFRTSSIGSSSTNTAASTSELLICFASRLSSSSMKISKSMLSPGRAARDCGPVSLTSSLSRRLRTNGSLKGGQASPFFTTSGKKRGCSFENPEPSSPKVTCIGQVRVKTKKKVKQTRSFSKRRGGDVSFRKIEQPGGDGAHQGEDRTSSQQRFSNPSGHAQTQPQSQECSTRRNQRWVHLPISICEGLRSFGSEFSCFFPCKGSCFSTSEKEKTEKERGSGESENGCGAVFTRWLVSVNDGEGGKRREIELVVGGGDEEEILAERYSMRSSRRHVFEDIEVKNDRIEVKGQRLEGGEEAARVSICIPPKNALLLMRCRSDPMKMASSLANKFDWDAKAAHKVECEDTEERKNDELVGTNVDEFVDVQDVDTTRAQSEEQEELGGCEVKDEIFMGNKAEIGEVFEHIDDEQEALNEAEVISDIGDVCDAEESQGRLLIISFQEMVGDNEQEQERVVVTKEKTLEEEEEEEEVESNMSSFEALLDQENAEHYEDYPVRPAEDAPVCDLTSSSESDEEESDEGLHADVALEQQDGEDETQESNPIFTECYEENQEETQLDSEEESTREDEKEEQKAATSPTVRRVAENREFVVSSQEAKKAMESSVLPDCLLLMMCEPKLSMEVSKETWVCSTDFLRWLPERPLKPPARPAKVGSGGETGPMKRRISVDSKPKPNSLKEKNDVQQPRRSSCSLPPATAAASMATIIEQRLVNAVAYEPLVLTRCKSEPMSTAAAKLLPESHFWKNAMKKLEPHRRATIGAAGVGF